MIAVIKETLLIGTYWKHLDPDNILWFGTEEEALLWIDAQEEPDTWKTFDEGDYPK